MKLFLRTMVLIILFSVCLGGAYCCHNLVLTSGLELGWWVWLRIQIGGIIVAQDLVKHAGGDKASMMSRELDTKKTPGHHR